MRAIIELTNEVALNFFSNEFSLSKREEILEHLPFDDFEIAFPQSVFQTKKQVLGDLIKQTGITEEMESYQQIEELARKYSESKVTLRVQNDENKLKCSMFNREITSTSITLFSFVVPKGLIAIPLTTFNNFANDDTHAGFMLLNTICSVVDAFNNPKIVKKESTEYVPYKQMGKPAEKTTKKNATYISTTKYILEGVPMAPVAMATYNRITECWNVRGHFRKCKDGSRVWIHGYQKGTTRTAAVSNFKITK